MLQQTDVETLNFKGYSLFTNPECKELRHRNRGVVMANIIEDNIEDSIISMRGTALLLGYFRNVPDREKSLAHAACEKALDERGVQYREA